MLAGLILLVLVLYRDTTLYLGELWSRLADGPYGHGFLVLAISLYLAYERRGKILALVPCPSAFALPAIAACALVWLAAALADIQVVQAVILLPLIISVIWAVAGGDVMRQLLFPVLFIAFALPLWSPLLPVLREVTAAGAFFLTRLSGITAHLQDYEVQLSSGQLSIETACSGLNYFMAALTLGVLYAYLNYRDFRSRLLVVVMTAGAAVLANILRVFVIIYLADITDMQHPLVQDHLMLGWYLFGALVLVLLFVDHLIYRRRAALSDTAAESVVKAGSAGCGHGHARHILLLLAATMMIVSGPAVAWWVKHQNAGAPNWLHELPAGESTWSGPAPVDDSWMPVYHGANALRRGYHKDGDRVLLYVGLYPQQRQGSELINDLNSISDGDIWKQTGAERPVVSAGGRQVTETELVSAGGRRRLVWYCYRVAGRYTTSRYVAKTLQLYGLLTGRQGAAVIAMAAEHDRDIAEVRGELGDFLAAMEPALARVVDGQPNMQGRER